MNSKEFKTFIKFLKMLMNLNGMQQQKILYEILMKFEDVPNIDILCNYLFDFCEMPRKAQLNEIALLEKERKKVYV